MPSFATWKRVNYVLFFCLLLFRGQAQTVLTPEEPLQVRGGLPGVLKRIAQKKPLTIAYFGGSITEAAGGWREQSLSSLQQLFPRVPFSHINASIGGTGSDLAAFRVAPDVLRHNPHLVVIEFAVNDAAKPGPYIKQSMEGIVRQIKKKTPAADILLVYTLKQDMLPALQSGQFPVSVQAMEGIADAYRLPSLFLGKEVLSLLRNGKMLPTGEKSRQGNTLFFSPDGVHPFAATGHRLYAAAFVEAFRTLLSHRAEKEKALPLPVSRGNWEAAAFAPLNLIEAGGWKKVVVATDTLLKRFARHFKTVWTGDAESETFCFTFTGTRFGFYDIIGPGTGALLVSIDGKPDTIIRRFDRWSTFWRPHYVLLPELSYGKHVVTVRVAASPLDKESLLQKKLDEKEKHLYRHHSIYLGQLLLIGHLHKPYEKQPCAPKKASYKTGGKGKRNGLCLTCE